MKLIDFGGNETEVSIGTALCGIGLTKVRISQTELNRFIAIAGRERWFAYRDNVLRTRFRPNSEYIRIESSEAAPEVPKFYV